MGTLSSAHSCIDSVKFIPTSSALHVREALKQPKTLQSRLLNTSDGTSSGGTDCTECLSTITITDRSRCRYRSFISLSLSFYTYFYSFFFHFGQNANANCMKGNLMTR